MNLNEFAKEVHENAVRHGWWPKNRTVDEVLSLIHSEWSEALEAYRNNEPMMYKMCEIPMAQHPCEMDECKALDEGAAWECCSNLSVKPEGVAVELADGCIRILDACAAWRLEADIGYIYIGYPGPAEQQDLPRLVDYLHSQTSNVFTQVVEGGQRVCDCKEYIQTCFARMMTTIYVWLKKRGVNLDAVMEEKHCYNLTRPYKHGGKKI